MKYSKLHHGSDYKFESFKEPSFFFIDNSEIASTYGLNVYECSCEINNVLEFEEGNDLEYTSSGFRRAGTSKKTIQLIKELLSGSSDSDIEYAIDFYKQHGLSTSPDKIFGGAWNVVINNLKRLGFQAMTINDESMIGARGGVYPAILIIDFTKINIEKILVYDDYGEDAIKEYSFSDWKLNLKGELFESFIGKFRKYDELLIESISIAYKRCFN